MTRTLTFPRLMLWHLAALIYVLIVGTYSSFALAPYWREQVRLKQYCGGTKPDDYACSTGVSSKNPNQVLDLRHPSHGFSNTRAVKPAHLELGVSSQAPTVSAVPDPSIRLVQGIRPERAQAHGGSASGLEPFAESPWTLWNVSAYAHTCILPRVGPEGPPHLTASGLEAIPNWSLAAPPEYAFGTVFQLSTEGVVTTRVVHDRGHAFERGSRKLDLFMESCQRARTWGRRWIWARVVRTPLGGTQ